MSGHVFCFPWGHSSKLFVPCLLVQSISYWTCSPGHSLSLLGALQPQPTIIENRWQALSPRAAFMTTQAYQGKLEASTSAEKNESLNLLIESRLTGDFSAKRIDHSIPFFLESWNLPSGRILITAILCPKVCEIVPWALYKFYCLTVVADIHWWYIKSSIIKEVP